MAPSRGLVEVRKSDCAARQPNARERAVASGKVYRPDGQARQEGHQVCPWGCPGRCASGLYFNAARLDRSMALKTSDYVALAKPRLERIAALG
jgi:hypothetical protein